MSNDTSPNEIEQSLLEWARDQKEEASDRYHEEDSGSFEQGLVLGRRQGMADVVEFLLERSRNIESEQ